MSTSKNMKNVGKNAVLENEVPVKIIKKKRVRFDRRQELLAKEIIEDAKNGVARPAKDLLVAAGYSVATAEASAKRTLNSDSLRELLLKDNTMQNKIDAALRGALEANTVVVFQGTATSTNEPDHKVRLQAASLAGDFMGAKKTVVENRNLNLDVSVEDLKSIFGLG